MTTPSEKEFLKNIADQFRCIRIDMKISLRKAYRDTGINIVRIESGTDNITLTTLRQLCSYYRVSLLQFNYQIMSSNQQNNLPGINIIVNQQVNSTVSVQNASGSTQNPSDSIQIGNGCVQDPSGSLQNPAGSVQNGNSSTQNAVDNILNQSDTTQNRNGNIQNASDSDQNHSDTVQKIRHRIQNSNYHL